MEIGNKGALFCDLHTHSTFSDGTLTPEALVELAVKQELGAVALTDHNTVAGCARFAAAAAGKPIRAARSLPPISAAPSCTCSGCFCPRLSLPR